MDAVTSIELGWTLPADCVSIEFSDHAVERANKRVFRRLNLAFAERSAWRLLPDAVVSKDPPDWNRGETGRAVAWLIAESPRVAFPLIKSRKKPGSFLATTANIPTDSHP